MNTRISEKNKKNRSFFIAVSVIFAAGILGLFLGFRFKINPIFSLGHTLVISSGLWAICKTYVSFLWQKYPWERSPVIHIILEVFGIFIFTMAFGSALYTIELKLLMIEPADDLVIQAFITLLITYLITAIHELIYFYGQWMANFSRSIKLERDNIEANYETLKSQVNPHFLFNSLNSLTNLVDDKPVAVEYIQNLSGFLRYILSSNDKDVVYLKDEIKVLKKYLEIQKSRFRDSLVTSVEVPSKYELYTIPPLSLQMIVENCIKHNVISANSPLMISVSVENEYLYIRNNLQRKNGTASTGQGLNNIRARYKFFTSREVIVRETDNEFLVAIPLLIVEL